MVYVDANNNFIKEVINLIFIRKKTHPDSIKRFTETDIIKMLDLLIDNIIAIFIDMFIAMFDARVFQPTVGRLLDDVFLYSYVAEFIKNDKKLTRSFNYTFLCIDDVLFTK
jgi:hypothetical protein